MHRHSELILKRVFSAGVVLTAFAAFTPRLSAQLPAPPVVGAGSFNVGGYAAVVFSRPEHPESAERADVSELVAALMAWGQIFSPASYFVEFDVAKRTAETWTGREADEHLVPVRLYLEYAPDDLFRIRVGRFLTPVGHWNERHAEPLTWTPTRPLTTYRPFAKSLTGLLVAGEGDLGGHDLGYALFWAPSGDLDGGLEEAQESSFVRALGGRVAAELRPGFTLGASLARVRRSRPADDSDGGTAAASLAPTLRQTGALVPAEAEAGEGERLEDTSGRTLLGADLRWERAAFDLDAEATWMPRAGDAGVEGGGFLSLAVRTIDPLWVVARAETYRPVDGRTARIGFLGVTLRAHRRFVAKFGRQFSENPSTRIPDGWFLSFSSLF